MKYKHLYKTLMVLVVVMLASVSCSKDDAEIAQLTVQTTDVSFLPEGGSSDISFSTNGAWTLLNGATWLHLSQGTGDAGDNTVTLTADENGSGFSRSVIINLETKNGKARRIKVTQTGNLYPSYNLTPKPADMSGMASTATQLMAKIKQGINIGNTMELIGNNADPTEANIKFIKQMGFNAVRLPCGWNSVGKASESSVSKIDATYIARVKQIVQWCVENDLYVMVNIHWDGSLVDGKYEGWLEENVKASKQDAVNAKQKALWEQIATALRDFDEHLMFASANEPNAGDRASTEILMTYHKTFMNAVRSTGGRNTYRTLVLQGHPDYIYAEDFAALNDPTPNRLVFEWHNYSPSSMTILNKDAANGGWDNVRFYWSAANHVAGLEAGIQRNSEYGEEADILLELDKIKTNFIDKGIPCLMGEYSCQRFSATTTFVPQDLVKHNKSVDDWWTFNTKQCKLIGGAPFIWDTGGLFDRATNTVKDQRSLDAIMAAHN